MRLHVNLAAHAPAGPMVLLEAQKMQQETAAGLQGQGGPALQPSCAAPRQAAPMPQPRQPILAQS